MPMPDLMDEIVLARNKDHGAPTCLITGRLGSGKTSLLADLALEIHKLREEEDRPENEKLFWRGQESCQFMKLYGEIDYKILVPETTKVTFVGENGINLKKYKFGTIPELYEKAEPEKLNVIYISYEELIDFMDWLQKTTFEWNSFFCDEVEALAPQGVGGKRFDQNMRVANILKEARKYYLSFYSTTQGHQDIDWRVRSKIMAYIQLAGSPPMERSPVYKSALQALDVGEAWVSVGGNYEKFEYPPYVTKHDIKARISYSPKRVPKPEIVEEAEDEWEKDKEKEKKDEIDEDDPFAL